MACSAISFFTFQGCSNQTPPAPTQHLKDTLHEAKASLREGDYARAIEIVSLIAPESKQWQAAQLIAGEAATKSGQLQTALEFYLKAAKHDEGTEDGHLALFSAAEVYLELGQLSSAEEYYRKVLQHDPENGLTNERMAFLLSISGRRWEALDHYFVLIRSGTATYRELALAADVGRPVEQLEFLEKCHRLAPNDQIVLLALATHAYSEGLPDAQSKLQKLISIDPELISAQAMLGEFYLEAADEAQFLNWHQALPESADESPDVWFLRGLWARQKSELRIAADCFQQSLLRTPFHRRAMYSLGQILVAIDDPQAEKVLEYSELLIELSQAIDQVLVSEGNNPVAVRKCAMTLERLGRIWEACAWGIVGREKFPKAVWHAELFSRYRSRLNEELPRVLVTKNPVQGRMTSTLPEFDQLIAKNHSNSPSEMATLLESVGGSIRFEETKLIDFKYHNADDPTTKGLRTFEQTGGGVAVIDYDLDGFPDLFLSQGTEWETGSPSPTPTGEYFDQLNRNLGGSTFQVVSQHLSKGETGYGQGCTVGDFNNDGFPDLYVANVGENCLYENMGDGTFLDVTEVTQIKDQYWTSSVMLYDLNADGLSDIYDVNYLSGDGIYQKICEGRACSPSNFPGAPDRVHINQGNGTFQALPESIESLDSKGLGIVAFEMTPNRRPSIFIANDQVANFFLVSEPATNEFNIQLSNHALITGLAFNEDGLSMACMGVAAADFDKNNQTDLFVTNFLDESNTLYLQDSPGLFSDATKERGLQANSLEFTSWGTQPLDADLDGDFDLVVVSGHVDDYRDEGGQFLMRPQFFENRAGKFAERFPSEVGDWFDKKSLGRGLAKLDWNRDGLPDFVVSNVNAPVSLMKNQSKTSGHFINVKLAATTTARDAIGVRVSLTLGNEEIVQQLTAGDGYMASNERLLSFGLENLKNVERLTVYWPSGSRSIVESPPVNSNIILVEDLPLATCSYQEQQFSKEVLILREGE